MKIRISSLRKGTNLIDEEFSPKEFGLEDESLKTPVRVYGEIDNLDTMLEVRLQVLAKKQFICDKCAIDTERIFESELTAFVLFKDAKGENEAEGLIFAGKIQTEADITQEIIDSIYGSIPTRLLCKADCKGLCFHCGTDLNESECECELES